MSKSSRWTRIIASASRHRREQSDLVVAAEALARLGIALVDGDAHHREILQRRREAGAYAVEAGRDLDGAGEAQDERPRQDEEGDHHRDRIAGQPHERGAADLAERHWPSRLDGKAPEMQRSLRLDGRLDMILVAGGHAAR